MLEGFKPRKHRFTAAVINISLELFKKGLGYRQIENVFKALNPYVGQKKAPSDSVIRQWIMRTGHFKLHNQLPEGKWMLVGDVTIDIGVIKALVTVGADLNKLEERGNYTLSLNDLEIVGIHPTKQANGEFSCHAFKEGIERLGGIDTVEGLVIDQGSDVKKGAKLLQQANTKLKVFHDISHKLALVLKKDLENDSLWEKYTQQLRKTKQLVQQTELAALQPPNQRSKARFMNVSLYINWPNRIFRSKAAGHLEEISEDRYQEYFGWLSEYSEPLSLWEQKVGVVEMVKETLRQYGLSEEVYDYLLTIISEMPLEDEVESFICDVFTSIHEEVEKLDENQVVAASTEIVESLFGTFKCHTSKGGQGITGNVLTIGALVGEQQTPEQTCTILEKTPVRQMLAWVDEKVGNTLTKMRNRFLNGKKGTKFVKVPVVATNA